MCSPTFQNEIFCSYFLIPMSNEIYLFIHCLNTRREDKNQVFVVFQSRVLESRDNCYKPSQKSIFTV